MLQESPATRGSHFHLTIISIIFLWLRSSKHSSAIIEILVDSGIVEVVFDLVATCSVHLEAKTPQPTTPLVCNIDDEDDVFCTCEHSDARYSELYLKISLFILLHLCDRTNFDPETPLTVSSVHMKVVSKISTLCHEILQSHLFDNPSPAIAISVLFFQLAHHLRGKILPVYEQWVEVSIEGVGHNSSRYTRKYFALSLRTLVPLAPVLLRSLHWSDPLRKKGASTTVNLVGNVFLAQYPLLSERYLLDQNENLADQQESIMKDLIARLDGPGVEENRSLDLSRLLRPYQLRGRSWWWLRMISVLLGIEWILHLWSSGLGGVLADEMGLGKVLLLCFLSSDLVLDCPNIDCYCRKEVTHLWLCHIHDFLDLIMRLQDLH